MKYFLIFAIAFSLTADTSTAQTQKPKSTAKKAVGTKPKPKSPPAKSTAAKTATAKPKPKPTPQKSDPAVEKAKLDEAIAAPTATERAAAIQKFLKDFPKSVHLSRARESLVVARAALGDEKLQAGEVENGIALFKLAVEDAPSPFPDKLFTEIIATLPANLFWRGQREAAFDVARMIEKRIENNAAQLLGLANFYVGIENGAEAMRLAEVSAKLEPNSPSAYQTIGLAHRMNFDLDRSAASYSKALELDPESLAAKRSLADMKRALGKPDEAAALYTEILVKDENDLPARTGLILSLFNSGKRAEAESQMAKSLEQNPGNVILLAGAAYWYAAHDEGTKAVELGQQAVDVERRYIWSHIALARGLIKQNKPVEAERVLIKARAFGNFPTLEYEIASARLAAGFYRDAAEGLQKSFALKDGKVQANLGGRVLREENNFVDLLAFERRASIFEPASADSPESAAQLKALLDLNGKLNAPSANESEVTSAVDEFIGGGDKMKFHRKLYAASALLEKNVAIPKVLEIVKSATGNADDALDVSNPNSAAMAGDLYESRSLAFARGEFIIVPEIPRQTLSAILRGRMEEITGWALYQQKNYPDAAMRLRRAISVLPDNSAWWRSATWRLGAALAADGKEAEALDYFIKSYKSDKPDFGKYVIVETLYKRVNGGTEGLEAKIGPERMLAQTAAVETAVVPAAVAKSPEPDATPVTIPNSIPVAESAKQTVAEKAPETPLETRAAATPEPIPQATPVVEEPKSETPKIVPQPQNAAESSQNAEPLPAAGENPARAEPKQIETVKIGDQIKPVAEPETNADVKTEAPPTAVTTKPAKGKELFEPIIITIPSRTPQKPTAPPVEKRAEPATGEKKREPEAKPGPESTPATAEAKTKDEGTASGAERPRVVDGKEVKLEEKPVCTIGVSQENISLINNGGNVGILVSLDGDGDIKEVAASSSSPKDVEVVLEPEIAGVSGRRFYVIKSISPAIGVYQITFTANCGKKEIIVNVR